MRYIEKPSIGLDTSESSIEIVSLIRRWVPQCRREDGNVELHKVPHILSLPLNDLSIWLVGDSQTRVTPDHPSIFKPAEPSVGFEEHLYPLHEMLAHT